MKIDKEETSSREAILNIELDARDVEPFLERAYRRSVQRVQIPGFRRGKAPRAIVESFVGRNALLQEALDFLVPQVVERAIKEEDLDPFGPPDTEVVSLEPVTLKAVVPLPPLVELGDYRDLRLASDPVEVSQEQVDGVVEQLRRETAPWDPVDRPVQFGDLVTLDVEGWVGGQRVANDKGVEYIPTQNNPLPLPGFSVHIEGMSKGDAKEFTLMVPSDHPDRAMADKECRFTVKVLEVREKRLPELNDEFARSVGDGYESLEALRKKVGEDLRAEGERVEGRRLREKALEEVILGARVELSPLLVEREIDHLLEEQAKAQRERRTDMETYLRNLGKTAEELREELRPRALERLTRSLVLGKLVEVESIQVTPEEVDQEIETISSGSGAAADSLRQAFSSREGRSSLANAVLTRKALGRLEEIVKAAAPEALPEGALGQESGEGGAFDES